MLKLGSLAGSRIAALGLLGALAQGSLACGGGATEKPAAAPAAVVAAAPVVKEEPPDLSPVAAPADLIAVARFKSPSTAIETVSSWANFPFKIQSAVPSDLKGLENVIAWDAPVELAVALDPLGEGKVPEPLTVLSIGISSLDSALDFAKAQGQAVHKLRAGVYRVGESDDLSCAVAAAIGSAPARLVCGHRAHDVDGLLNFATRGLPNEPLPNLDFQLELRLAPVKKKYGAELGSARLFGGFLLREIQMDNPRFDRALSDVAYGLIDEALALVHDLDKVRIDANIDRAKNQVDLRLNTKFVGQQSWTAQAISETISRATPAPEAFWQMPADVAGASYTVGWSPARLKPLGRSLGELFDAFMEAQKAPAALRGQGAKAIEGVFGLDTNVVRAYGGLTDFPSDPLLAADYRFFGWQISEAGGDPKPVLAVFDSLASVMGNKDVAKALKDKLELDPKLLPKISSHGVTVKGYKAGAKAYRVDLSRELLQKLSDKSSGGMQDVANALAQPVAKGKPTTKSVPVSFVVVSDGDHSYVGASPDEKAVIKRLESLKEPKTQALRTRAGLEVLKSPHVAGGFFTLRGFHSMFPAGSKSSDAAAMLNALPQHGDTPILFTSDANPSGPETTMTFSVPRAAIGDLGNLVPVLALAASNSGVLDAHQ